MFNPLVQIILNHCAFVTVNCEPKLVMLKKIILFDCLPHPVVPYHKANLRAWLPSLCFLTNLSSFSLYRNHQVGGQSSTVDSSFSRRGRQLPQVPVRSNSVEQGSPSDQPHLQTVFCAFVCSMSFEVLWIGGLLMYSLCSLPFSVNLHVQ